MTKIKSLQTALVSDRHLLPSKIKELIGSEVFKCLQNYLELKPENMTSRFDVNSDGDYEFCLSVTAKRIKIMGILPKGD